MISYASRLGGCVVLAVIGMLTVTAEAAQTINTPRFERVALSNGAVLLLMERHDVPLIEFQAVVRGGAVVDPRDRFGTASLVAGLLEKGAGVRDALSFAQTVAGVGGTIDADASTEAIHVSGSFLSRDRKLMIELLADMLQRPRLEESELDSLRARQIEFIRAAKDSDLSALTAIYGDAALFAEHPYGNPVIGSEEALARIGVKDIRDYYTNHFGSDRLIIAVAGDFKTAEMKQLLSQAFSKWRKATGTLPAVPAAPRISERRVVLIDAPDSVQSYFWAGNVGIARNDERRAAIDVVNTSFGGRFTSMLNSELRVRTGLSYGARSSFERYAQPGSWQLSSFTQTKTTIEAIDLALATLDKLHEAELSPQTLQSSKSYALGQFPLALETAAQWAYQLSLLEFYQLPADYLERHYAALAAVELDDARRVIGQVFPRSDEVLLVVIGQAGALRESLRKYGPITELKLADGRFR